MGEYHLTDIDGEYFAVKKIIDPITKKRQETLFRDYNNEVMSLGTDKEWAKDWIKTKNEIDGTQSL